MLKIERKIKRKKKKERKKGTKELLNDGCFPTNIIKIICEIVRDCQTVE